MNEEQQNFPMLPFLGRKLQIVLIGYVILGSLQVSPLFANVVDDDARNNRTESVDRVADPPGASVQSTSVSAPPNSSHGQDVTPASEMPFPLDPQKSPPAHDFLGSPFHQKLTERGISLQFEVIEDLFGNPTGGVQQKFAPVGRVTGLLSFDLEKLVGLRGGSFYINGMEQFGDNLSTTYIRSYDLLSSIAAPPTLRLREYYYRQTLFGKRLLIELGQIAAQTEFNNQYISATQKLSGFATFLNNSLCCNPLISYQTFLPTPAGAKPGAVIQVNVGQDFIKTGFFSGSRHGFLGDESGLRFDLRDSPVIAVEYAHRVGGEVTRDLYKFGILYNVGRFPNLANKAYTQGNYVFYVDTGHSVFHQKSHGKETGQGLDVQCSVSAAPQRINKNDFELLTGLRYAGLSVKRKADILAIGAVYAHFSRDWPWSAVSREADRQTSQANFELGYKIVVKPWFSVWPDFQYVYRPNGYRQIPSAPVAGLRLVFDY